MPAMPDLTDPATLLAVAESLRANQAILNMINGPTAHSDNAWGDLKRAIVRVLTHYLTEVDVPDAAEIAGVVLDEVYDNGESITYNLRLAARGHLGLPAFTLSI